MVWGCKLDSLSPPLPPMAQYPLMGQGFLINEASRTHSDAPRPVGLLWASDQPDTQTSTLQYTTLTRDRHPCPDRIRTHNPSKRAAADPHLRSRGHWERQTGFIWFRIQSSVRFMRKQPWTFRFCTTSRIYFRNCRISFLKQASPGVRQYPVTHIPYPNMFQTEVIRPR